MTMGRAGNVWLMILMLGGTLLGQATTALRAGASAVPITPFGKNPDWDGPVKASGVWGEIFTDSNQNGRWDPGEPFVDDRRNSELDSTSRGRYDGIFLAGFGNDRIATGKHDDLWVRALVLDSGTTRIAIVAVDLIGYYENAGYYGIAHAQKLLDQKLGIQEIILSSTHNHEGPDTIGLWGNNQDKRRYIPSVSEVCGSPDRTGNYPRCTSCGSSADEIGRYQSSVLARVGRHANSNRWTTTPFS